MADDRNRNRRDGGRPPEMIVRDIVLGEPKQLPDKNYELGISLLIMAGKWPAHGATYQFLVNGTLVGNAQLVVEGRASAKVCLPPGKSTIAVQLHHSNFGVRLVSLAEKETPVAPEKKKKEAARLEILGTTQDETQFFITLVRVGNEGKGHKGTIAYFDPGDAGVKTEDTDENGVAVIGIELGESKEKATFYLPEKPSEKIEKEIPAKKTAATAQLCTPPAPQLQKSLAERMRDAYRRGRQ